MRVPATTVAAQHEGRVEAISEEGRGTKSATLTVPDVDVEIVAASSSTVAFSGSVPGAIPGDLRPPGSQPHLPGRLPRKAASADSIRSPRSGTPQPVASGDALPPLDASVSHGGDTSRPHAQTLSSPPSSMSLSGLFFSKVTRKRAVSTYNTDCETSAPEESDFDRGSVSARGKGRVRSRLLSLRSTKTTGSAPETPLQPPSAYTYSTHPTSSDAPPNVPALPESDSSVSQGVSRSRSASKEPKRPRSYSVGNSAGSSAARLVKRLSVGNQTPKVKFLISCTLSHYANPYF